MAVSDKIGELSVLVSNISMAWLTKCCCFYNQYVKIKKKLQKGGIRDYTKNTTPIKIVFFVKMGIL